MYFQCTSHYQLNYFPKFLLKRWAGGGGWLNGIGKTILMNRGAARRRFSLERLGEAGRNLAGNVTLKNGYKKVWDIIRNLGK